MVDMTSWMETFLQQLHRTFPDRVWFVGLQGSYARGEATEDSDIDVVVILDELSAADVHTYRDMLDRLSHREKICGFLSGKQELLNWEPSDLFQFYHDTKPITGSLDDLAALLDEEAINRAIQSGVCNIYHGCVHNMLHGQSEDVLKDLYKSASFVMQAICFQQTGQYVRCQNDLREQVSADDRLPVDTFLHLKNGGEVRFQEMADTLFSWTKRQIEKIKP